MREGYWGGNLIWCERLGEFESLFPVKQISAHLERRDRTVGVEEVILSEGRREGQRGGQRRR